MENNREVNPFSCCSSIEANTCRQIEEENAQIYIAPIPMGKKNYFTFYRYQFHCVINVTLKPIPFSMNNRIGNLLRSIIG